MEHKPDRPDSIARLYTADRCTERRFGHFLRSLRLVRSSVEHAVDQIHETFSIYVDPDSLLGDRHDLERCRPELRWSRGYAVFLGTVRGRVLPW
jgi:hypothetical protein